MKQNPHRGGKREGAGRKPLGKAKYTVTLTEVNAEHAKKMKSNFSGLLDRLLEDWIKKGP
jgi:hypothetical protein